MHCVFYIRWRLFPIKSIIVSSPVQSPDTAKPGGGELRLRAELDSAVLLRLRTILPLLGLLYVVVTASQFMLLGWTLRAPLIWVNSMSAVVCLVLTAGVWNDWIRSKWAHAASFVAALAILANGVVQLEYHLELSHATGIVLLLIGAGCTFLSLSWLVLVIVTALAACATLAALHPQSLEWAPLSSVLLASTIISLGAYFFRARTYRRLIRARLQEEQRKLQLREVQQRYALAVSGANDGLWYWDLKTYELFFSHRWNAIIGYEEDEMVNRPDDWLGRVHFSDLKRLKLDILNHINGETTLFQSEYRIRHKDGTYLWVISRGLVGRGADGKAVRFAGSLTDISQLKKAESRLLHDAYNDRLTGLPNRNFLTDHLGRALERKKVDRSYRFAVAFLDLDQFKVVNDNLGHLIGDQLLAAVAERLRGCKRNSDLATRFGGDEFVLLWEGVESHEDARAAASRVQEALEAPFHLDGHEVFTTASLGITLSSGPYEKAADMLRDADIAMYQAKAKGFGEFQIFSQLMHAHTAKLWKLQNDLRRAVERDELVLHYQPLVAAASGKIVGAEALVRWNHPSGQLVSPAEFIPLAEETGLIHDVGRWVLRNACQQIRVWRDKGLIHSRVSVNVSPNQLNQDDFADIVEGILAETELDPQFLRLELTESALIDNEQQARSCLSALYDLGIRLTIDDFGTGYSSLSYLKRFNFDAIKISSTFLDGTPFDPDATALVTGLMSLAHSMNLDVVVEGVETNEQLALLRLHDCDLVQGYLASRPVEANVFEELLRSGESLLAESENAPVSIRALSAAAG